MQIKISFLANPEAKMTGSKKKILIIDDEKTFVKLIRTHLTSVGFDVITANNGQEGLGLAQSQKPDLILLDVMMPKMDGYTMVLEFHKSEELKKIPIIVVTAKENMKDMFGMIGTNDYFVKPVNFDDLLARVNERLSP